MATEKQSAEKEYTVEEKLSSLYQLQKIMTEIDKIRTLRGELPLEVQDLEDEIAGLETRLQNYQLDIKNYEGKYKISNLGRVKSLERQVSHDGITWTQPERIMCHWCGTTSLYDCVRLYKGGVGKKFSVHRLVAQHFLPDWNPGLEVNHIDGNRDNNRADNLEMCTHQRNMEHAIAGGLKRDYGEKSVNAKLTNGQAEEIRVRYSPGQASQNSLAKQYGVSRQTVSAIIRYKKYIR